MFFFFFFQAEDGIRDGHVTGVQTCALPICRTGLRFAVTTEKRNPVLPDVPALGEAVPGYVVNSWFGMWRSEERRVGKECGSRGGPDGEEKKKRENEIGVRLQDAHVQNYEHW